MCRLILAQGTFSSAKVLEAAMMMSCGRTANHDGPTQRHPDGWGAVWRDGKDLAVHRDVEPIEASAARSPVGDLATDFLAIHVRHATLARNHGMQFTHPLQHSAPTRSWYFLHNGFLPTVHQHLGKAQSEFDSAEYLQYLMQDSPDGLDLARTREKLAAIPPGGTSANAFLISQDRAYVIHWTPADTRYPVYFTMHRLETPAYSIISSEVIETLAPRQHWRPMPARQIHEIAL
jgi:predicted glutamine amidotransferase